jgi:hypothetical protein
MFISDRFVYLQMQKTGSTHVTKVLKKYSGGRTTEKHGQMTDPDAFRDRLVVSSIRNPWDWYVSLWSFGCEGGGGLFKYLTSLPVSEVRHAWRYKDWPSTAQSVLRLATQIGRRPDWSGAYTKTHEPEQNFRTWLKLMLGPEGLHIAKEGYAASAIKTSAGFMTYRFLALTTDYRHWNTQGRAAQDYDELVAFADRHSIARRILRMETLNGNLAGLLQDFEFDVSIDDLDAIAKTNTSTHRKYDSYYDDETYRLVAERERFIIDRFGYTRF